MATTWTVYCSGLWVRTTEIDPCGESFAISSSSVKAVSGTSNESTVEVSTCLQKCMSARAKQRKMNAMVVRRQKVQPQNFPTFAKKPSPGTQTHKRLCVGGSWITTSEPSSTYCLTRE